MIDDRLATTLRHLFTLCLFVATAAKIVAVVALGPASIEMDAFGYWSLSSTVMQGDPWMISEPIAYRTPVYPWMLAIIRSALGNESLIALVTIQAVLAIVSLSLAGLIARELTKSVWALPLTLLISLPAVSSITYSATVLTESLFTVLLMASTLSVLKYCDKPKFSTVIIATAFFCLTLLTRPIVLYLWLIHLLLAVGSRYRAPDTASDAPPVYRHAIAATVVAVILVSPWMIRNQRLFGSPFVTEFMGRNLWIVTFQTGSGAGLDLPKTDEAKQLMERLESTGRAGQWRATWHVSNGLTLTGLSDPEADRLMKRVALTAAVDHPWPFAYKAIRRIANFWRCAVTELPTLGSPDGKYLDQKRWSASLPMVQTWIDRRISRSVAANTAITIFAMLAVMILIAHSPTRLYGVWIGLIFVYFSVVTGLIEIPNYRYRMVLEPLVAGAIAAAICVLLDRSPAQTRRHD